MKKVLVSTALLGSIMIFAGGFRVSLQGVRQLAQAHTSAHAEDASVAFFNPAGISFIPAKFSVAAGGFGAMSKVTYQNPTTLESFSTQSPVGTPIYAAAAYKFTDKISVGFSLATPYGSTIEWPENWAGREIVQKMELRSFFFQPMISVKLATWASIGASYIYAKGKVDWTKAAQLNGGTVNIKDDKASGSGFGIGFYFQPDANWDISLAYRSPVEMNAKNGTATFNLPTAVLNSPVLGLNGANTDKFTATLPLVDEYTLGATYKITPKWQVSADLNYTGWERYNRLTIDFEKANAGNQAADPTVLVSPKNFHNTKTYRLGTQYSFNDMIAARLGWYYDESPYTDKNFQAETPSFNSNVVTGGFGFKFNKGFGVDVAGGIALPKARNVDNAYYGFYGQAKAKAYYFGLGLSYNAF